MEKKMKAEVDSLREAVTLHDSGCLAKLVPTLTAEQLADILFASPLFTDERRNSPRRRQGRSV